MTIICPVNTFVNTFCRHSHKFILLYIYTNLGGDILNERLKDLRKSLKMTQEEFARRIGIKRNTLANYEIGRNEPIDGIIFSICREFSVNENWLRYGEGEMFNSKSEYTLDEIAKEQNLTSLEYALVKAFLELDKNTRHNIVNSLKNAFEVTSSTDDTEFSNELQPSLPKDTQFDLDIDAEVEAYRLELEAEKRGRQNQKSKAL